MVQPNRTAAAGKAIAEGANVLVMDDGFQHLRLRRDMDIVLIDATLPFGYGYCLPRGLLREPVSALSDADAVVVTRSDAISPADWTRFNTTCTASPRLPRCTRPCTGRLKSSTKPAGPWPAASWPE